VRKKKAAQRRGHPPQVTRVAAASVSGHDPAGLPGILFPADVTGADPPDFVGMDLDFVISGPRRDELMRITIRFVRRVFTGATADAWGLDKTGAVAAHFRGERSGSWAMDMRTEADPMSAGQALMLMRLIELLKPPNVIAVTQVGNPAAAFSPLERPAVDYVPEGLPQAIADLARLEDYVGETVAVPEGFTADAVGDLRVAAILLAGETAEATWDRMDWSVTAAHARDLAAGPLKVGAADIDIARGWTVEPGNGQAYVIEPVIVHLHSARVARWPDTRRLPADAKVTIVLEPADTAHVMELRYRPAGTQAPHAGVMAADDPLILFPGEAFDELAAWLDEPPEPAPALVRAAARLRELRG
jgi:hypothetical protein